MVDPGLIIVNTLIFCLSFGSIYLHAVYTNNSWKFYQEYIIGFLIIGSICLSMIAIGNLGLICLIFNVITSLANLESIPQIISTTNYDCIDLKMALSNLMSSSAWMIYGIVIVNPNIILSNAISITVATILTVFHSYFRLFHHKYVCV